jgi:flagellar FliL protein
MAIPIAELKEDEGAAETPPPPPPARSSIKPTIAAILVVTVIAMAMGALFAIPPAAETPSPKNESALATELPASASLFDMPPIVTNLGAPRDTWIRLDASIVFDAKELPHPDVMAGEIAGDELAYLRTVSLSQIEGPIGLQNIRQDLNERASIRSGGKVAELIIRTLVVQ